MVRLIFDSSAIPLHYDEHNDSAIMSILQFLILVHYCQIIPLGPGPLFWFSPISLKHAFSSRVCLGFFYKKCTQIRYVQVTYILRSINPFKPNGIFHSYQVDQFIFVLRDVRWYFSVLFRSS